MNPAEVKTCKGYDFKIWTKTREEKPSLKIERDRLRVLSKPSNTVKKKTICKKSPSVKYSWQPFPASLKKLKKGKLTCFLYVMQGLN